MKSFKRLIQTLFYLLVFFLPFQTRWIYTSVKINGDFWEYGTFSIYATELLAGLIIALTVIYLLKQKIFTDKNGKRKWSKPDLKIFLMAGLATLIPVLMAINTSLALHKLEHFILGLAVLFSIFVIRPNRTKIVYALVYSGVIQSFFAIQQFVQQKVLASSVIGMAVQDPAILGTPVVETTAGRILRSFGSFPHPNVLGGFLMVVLILIIALGAKEKNYKSKVVLSLSFILCNIGLMLSGSRSACLAFWAGMLMLLVISLIKKLPGLKRSMLKFLIYTILIFVIFSVIQPDLVQTRLAGQARLEQKSIEERMAGLGEAWDIYKNNWLWGVGLGNYTLALYEKDSSQPAWYYQPVHNIYFLALIEFGVFLFIVLGVIILALATLIKNKLLIGNKKPLTWGFLTVVFGLLIIGLVDHYLYSLYFGIMLSFLIFALFLQSFLETE